MRDNIAGGQDGILIWSNVGELLASSFHRYIQLQAGLRQSCLPYNNLQEMQEMDEIRGNMLYILFTQLILLVRGSVCTELANYIKSLS